MSEAGLFSHAELCMLTRTCYYSVHLCTMKEKAGTWENIKPVLFLFVDSSFVINFIDTRNYKNATIAANATIVSSLAEVSFSPQVDLLF